MIDGTTRFGLASARVMAHDYDDEVVAANLDTGWFYSLTGSYRAVWCALADGYSVAELSDAAQVDERFVGAIGEVVELATVAGLLAPSARTRPASPLTVTAWADGSVEAFDDLQDALLLDPVHEVSGAGWPYAEPGATEVSGAADA